MENYKLERLLKILELYGLDEFYDYEEDCISFSPDMLQNQNLIASILDFLYDNHSWYLQVTDGEYTLFCERP